MPEQDNPVIVVGGGWAGLSCAVELSLVGHRVIVLESARQLGGRARRVAFEDIPVDNGQHLLIGAYRHTLSLLKRLNISLDEALLRERLNLHMRDCRGRHYELSSMQLLAPLNLLFGLLTARGFSLKEKWRAIQFGARLFTNAVIIEDDLPVADMLRHQKQSPDLISALWEPICLASLNTPIEEASARIFIRVLHDTFCRSAKDADLIIPRVDLGTLLPDPAADFIEQHGGNVHLGQRVTELMTEQRHVVGVKCGDTEYSTSHVVLAIPPHACIPLVKSHPALHDIAYNLNAFSYNPIVTVYLKYPPGVRPDRPVQGMLNSTSQWAIDRHITGQSGLIAVVISGPGPHMQMENNKLQTLITRELGECFPHWPAPENVMVIREKRATFSSRVNIDPLRPANKTALRGLWLCGDYTATGYPATIESAVISGKLTANQIHQEQLNQHDN